LGKLTSRGAVKAAGTLLRHGRLCADDVIAYLASADERDAVELSRNVSPHLDERDLVRVADATEARGLTLRHLVVALLKRGAWAPALACDLGDERMLFNLLPHALSLDDKKGRAAWVRKASDLLRGLLKVELVEARAADRDPYESRTLVLLRGAKYLAPHLPKATKTRLLEHLDTHVRREAAAGCYDELDYAYGAIDPVIELAHAWAAAGGHAQAAAHLAERDRRFASFLNMDELEEATQTLLYFSPARRRAWWPKLREWARSVDKDAGDSRHNPCEVAWLLAVLPPKQRDECLGALIDSGTDALALQRILQADGLAERIRSKARARLVEQMTSDAAGLPRAHHDYPGMLHENGVRAAAITASRIADELSVEQSEAVGAAAKVWSAWLKTGPPDAYNPVPIGIALACRWRSAIPDALKLMRRKDPEYVVRHEGWETLFTDKGVEGVLRRLEK